MTDSVFGITAAIVGAGFASGREIMQFFSQYGVFSWILILFSAMLMAFLLFLLMKNDVRMIDMNQAAILRVLWILLYGAVSGGMTAAGGELAALTVPFLHARLFGMAVTLIVCLKLSQGTIRELGRLGKGLIPGMAVVFLLCMRFQKKDTLSFSFSAAAFLKAAGYCGLNALLAAAVTAQAGKDRTIKEKRWIAILSGLIFGGLLALGNAVLMPYETELRNAALPMVLLLRGYGKAGFYLSAFVLYLAVVTTLIACLRGLQTQLPGKRKNIWAALIVAVGALLGFQEIVAKVYPVLGYLCLLSLLIPNFLKKAETIRDNEALYK